MALDALSNHYGKKERDVVSYEGPQFYDKAAVFQTYMQHRQRPDNPNDTLEKPILLALLGSVSGAHLLDLGCGDAALGTTLLAQGAASYLGLDGSRNMVAQAQQTLAGSIGQVVYADLRSWTYPPATFDCVLSRLALHYIADVDDVFQQVFQTLRPTGRFVFSVEHPVITSCDRAWQGGGVRQAWIVDDYFDSSRRVTHWLGEQVVKYHRTVEEYFRGLQSAGFVVEQLRESRPERQWFVHEETYQRRTRIPLFLFLAARKPV
jgi:SAM-dependent methyltransferase